MDFPTAYGSQSTQKVAISTASATTQKPSENPPKKLTFFDNQIMANILSKPLATFP